MSSPCHDHALRAVATITAAASIALVVLAAAASAAARDFRVCADPNNLPFSNDRGEGFENKLAELLARDLGADVHYTWWAQRRGFIRNTLKKGDCDVVMGVPSSFELALVTRPYYRSSYVFVTRKDRQLDLRSLDDPRLHDLKIGVQIIGDDYANTPPAHALTNRGIVTNVVGYTVYGDYAEPNPPARIVDAVARGDVDVAIAWGPLAGWAARHASEPLAVTPVWPAIDPPFLPFVFDIAMGVRRGETAFRDELDALLVKERPAIDALLDDYGVPRVSPAGARAGAPAAAGGKG